MSDMIQLLTMRLGKSPWHDNRHIAGKRDISSEKSPAFFQSSPARFPAD
jgi:hypothetical protein